MTLYLDTSLLVAALTNESETARMQMPAPLLLYKYVPIKNLRRILSADWGMELQAFGGCLLLVASFVVLLLVKNGIQPRPMIMIFRNLLDLEMIMITARV